MIWAWLACAPPDLPSDAADEVVVPVVYTVRDLREAPPAVGANVLVGPLSVLSGPTPGSGAVYLQSPEDGLGVEVRPGDHLDGWPPPIGTLLRLRGVHVGSTSAPVLYLSDVGDVELLGGVAETVVVQSPATPPGAYTLVSWPEVQITSAPDPSGRAYTSLQFVLEDRFRIGLPGLGNTGSVTGIVLPTGTVALRRPEDWVGTRSLGLIGALTLAQIRGGTIVDGAAVLVEATQATPWSRGDRYVLLQDAAGNGVWVDAEGFGDGRGQVGEIGVWQVEVRRFGAQPRLRTWWPHVVTGVREVVTSDEVVDGKLVERTVTGIGPSDVTGERATAEGWWLDDRFVPLAALGETAVVRAAVEARPDGSIRLAVLSYEAAGE